MKTSKSVFVHSLLLFLFFSFFLFFFSSPFLFFVVCSVSCCCCSCCYYCSVLSFCLNIFPFFSSSVLALSFFLLSTTFYSLILRKEGKSSVMIYAASHKAIISVIIGIIIFPESGLECTEVSWRYYRTVLVLILFFFLIIPFRFVSLFVLIFSFLFFPLLNLSLTLLSSPF